MEITSKTIILAVVSVILIAVILSGVFYLLKNSKQLIPAANKTSNPLARLGVSTNQLTPTPTTSSNNDSLPINNKDVVPANTKIYQGNNFVIKYPQKWGILTCNNSQNLELDPYNSNDLKNVACDRAIKPITILVSTDNLNCSGENIKIGPNIVIKSKAETANWLKNRWCLNKNGVSLDITNRINVNGTTGTGKDDFSEEIEKMINSL